MICLQQINVRQVLIQIHWIRNKPENLKKERCTFCKAKNHTFYNCSKHTILLKEEHQIEISKCHSFGLIGYYRSSCPNSAQNQNNLSNSINTCNLLSIINNKRLKNLLFGGRLFLTPIFTTCKFKFILKNCLAE